MTDAISACFLIMLIKSDVYSYVIERDATCRKLRQAMTGRGAKIWFLVPGNCFVLLSENRLILAIASAQTVYTQRRQFITAAGILNSAKSTGRMPVRWFDEDCPFFPEQGK
jgi:hypothetical protein